MSAPSPVLRGELAVGGPIEVLRDIETRRLTGLLRFQDDEVEGSIRVFGGEIGVDQESREDGRDPVDIFLELESGAWSLAAVLPPLPVSKGDERERSGSLAVHVPVDLMSYCEHAGLTGVLELKYGDRRADAVYEAGELLAIELDGRDATDLHEVFSWTQGRFRVALDDDAPRRFRAEAAQIEEPTVGGWSAAPKKKREDTRQFLRVVEMALADVIEQSEKARSPTRTSPPLPPAPKKRPRPDSLPPRKRRRDEPTVQLIYLTGEGPDTQPGDLSTRHVHVGTGRATEKVLTEAQPQRRAAERSQMGKPGRKKRGQQPKPTKGAKPTTGARPLAVSDPAPAPSPDSATRPIFQREQPEGPVPAQSPLTMFLGASGWALGVVVLGLLILAMLAKLPPVE